MNKKIPTPLAIIIIFLVTVAIIGVAFWTCPEKETVLPQDETADWQTYKNEEYGYEIRYPNDWILDNTKKVVTLNGPENEILSKEIEAGELYGEGYMPDISVSYYKTVSEEEENIANHLGVTTIDELVEKDILISSENKINFAGEKAYEAIWGGFGAYYSILIEKNSHLYTIQFGNRDSKEKLTEIDRRILSTFKFLK